MKSKLLLFVLAFCFVHDAIAKDLSVTPIEKIKGLSLVKIKSRRIQLELEQAVSVNDNNAVFVGLDDFGGEVFKLFFNEGGLMILADGQLFQTRGSGLKKILSLPISQSEFLSALKFESHENFEVTENKEQVEWSHLKKKNLKIVFTDFISINHQQRYPRHIVVSQKENFLDLKWIKVTVK